MLTKQRSSSEHQLRQVCAELDAALREGQPIRVEQCFAAHPILAATEDSAVELIYVEFATRQELGQRPSPEEYYFRFPWWKPALQRQFAIHDWLCKSTSEPVPPEHEPPRLPLWLGRYELLEMLAQSSVARVYRAWQHGLERAVAVKVLRQDANAPQVREQFCQEARTLAQLRHPNIMPVHDIGECDGAIFFSMAYLPGGSLADHLTSGQRPNPGTVVRWIEATARAVQHAHERGIIHRDIKPANILLDEDSQPVLSDFGLAAPARTEELLVLGHLSGSPAYMAPEQFSSPPEAVGPTTDIWALGVVLYELLTGRRPFEAGHLARLERQICTAEPSPLRSHDANLPEQLEAICTRCLRREPARRYPSAAALADELSTLSRTGSDA